LLVSAIIANAAKVLRGGVERAGRQIRQLFGKLRPEVSFSVSQSSWSVKLGTAVVDPPTQVRLPIDALNALERMASHQIGDRPMGLIIDEFQKVIETRSTVRRARSERRFTSTGGLISLRDPRRVSSRR
jgi:hypothetical protein